MKTITIAETQNDLVEWMIEANPNDHARYYVCTGAISEEEYKDRSLLFMFVRGMMPYAVPVQRRIRLGVISYEVQRTHVEHPAKRKAA